MSRKSLIICVAVLAVMVIGIGVAVSVLYSGTGSQKEVVEKVSDDSRYLLLPAVPSDAVVLCCLSAPEKALPDIIAGSDFPSELASAMANAGVKIGRMTVSLHFSGKLIPLYIFDMGKASAQPSESAALVMQTAASHGLSAEYQDCSTTGSESAIAGHSIVVASPSETLVKSSLRHLQKAVSIMDAPGFAEASSCVAAKDVVFVANETSGKIISSLFTGKYNSWAYFAPKVSDWMAFDAEAFGNALTLRGEAVTDGDISDFITVFGKTGTSSSALSSVLPSYTLSAMTLPVKNTADYIAAYQTYLDARQSLQTRQGKIEAAEKENGVSPLAFFTRLETKEVATASFISGGKLEKVNLIRVAKPDTLKNISGVQPCRYPSYASLIFGGIFELPDESYFTYRDGWLVSGSQRGVQEFAEGRTSEYTLKEYMVNAGLDDLFASEPASFMAYLSLTEDRGTLQNIFRSGVVNAISSLTDGSDYGGVFISAGQPKLPASLTLSVFSKEVKKSKPVAEREVTVTVPKGPFKVKNSGTGKMNLFYQQDNMYLCLKEEGGKGLWGVPFSDPICGTAGTIDYYANGKLQILFGAGSKLYLIDRLGRFVTGFPVDLKKDILIGPAIYDFNGARRYNVLVLHKDNTIEMYNLKGQKPASWSGIRPSEIIRGLPERIIVGGNTFWVVRTSVQTLIYPFGGGQPLTAFQGDQMVLPDSEVKVVDGSAVELQCYDGRSRTVKLK